jgi:hypothetical protein
LPRQTRKRADTKPFPDGPCTPAIPHSRRSANGPSPPKCDVGCLYPQCALRRHRPLRPNGGHSCARGRRPKSPQSEPPGSTHKGWNCANSGHSPSRTPPHLSYRRFKPAASLPASTPILPLLDSRSTRRLQKDRRPPFAPRASLRTCLRPRECSRPRPSCRAV